MTQMAVPISDDSNSGWSPTPVYARINELVPLDDTWVSSGGGVFSVKLAPLALPGPGSVQALLHLQKTGTDSIAVAVSLLQGSTVIATTTFSPGTSFAPFALTLTAAQQALITDYTNLHLQVSVLPECGTVSMPATLFASVSNGANCFCLTGNTITLTWNGTAWVGTGPFGSCGRNLTLTFSGPAGGTACTAYTLTHKFSDNCDNGTATVSLGGCTCSPLSFTYNVVFHAVECGCGFHGIAGAFNVTITP